MKKVVMGMSILVSSLLPMTDAEAEDSSIYYGIGLGSAQFSGDAIDDDIFVSGQELSDDAAAYSVFLGYQVNRHLSFELGYVDFGKVSERYRLDPDIVFVVAPNNTVSIESDGFTIASLFEYPVTERLGVFGLLGFSYLDVDRRVYGGDTGPDSSSNTEGEVFYGAGFKYTLADNLRIPFAWKHYDIDAASRPLEAGAEIDVFGASLEYRF